MVSHDYASGPEGFGGLGILVSGDRLGLGARGQRLKV